MITLDLYKNLIINKEDNEYVIVKKIGTKVFAAILIFCIPTLINLIFNLFSKMNIGSNTDASFLNCYQKVNLNLIKQLENEQELKLSEVEEEERKKALVTLQENEAKIKALQEENTKRNQSTSSNTSTYTNNTTDMNKQNKVYIKNGTFYAPSYKASNPNTYSGKDCPSGNPLNKGYNNKYGYNNYFWNLLQNFKTAIQKAGYNISYSSQGCRSYQLQVSYYKTMEKGRAAHPGRSNHEWGIASDVTFYKNASVKCGSNRTYKNCPGMKWAHEHAKEYGLTFPLINASYKEDWHLDPLKLKKY